jgi:hypothetical protein
MEKEISQLLDKLEKASNDEQKRLFVLYCLKLIECKEKGELREEEAAYKMVGAIQFDNLSDSPECEAIFDIAMTAEISRELSYAQPMEQWNEKTADKIKEKEWRELIITVQRAKKILIP